MGQASEKSSGFRELVHESAVGAAVQLMAAAPWAAADLLLAFPRTLWKNLLCRLSCAADK